jgi:hypothetical protein
MFMPMASPDMQTKRRKRLRPASVGLTALSLPKDVVDSNAACTPQQQDRHVKGGLV